MSDGIAQGFKNPDLKQIYLALQDGNIGGALQIIADGANVTNNLVSLKKITGADMDTVETAYNDWKDHADHVNWIILSDSYINDPTTGLITCMIRYKGEKVPA